MVLVLGFWVKGPLSNFWWRKAYVTCSCFLDSCVQRAELARKTCASAQISPLQKGAQCNLMKLFISPTPTTRKHCGAQYYFFLRCKLGDWHLGEVTARAWGMLLMRRIRRDSASPSLQPHGSFQIIAEIYP